MSGSAGDTALRIDVVDPHDDAAFDAWYDVHAAASLHGHDPLTVGLWTREELRVRLQDTHPRTWQRALLGTAGGRPVCQGHVSGSTTDNLDQAMVFVGTLPDGRGRGHGSAMLERLERLARDEGRTTALAEVPWSIDADAHGVGVPDVDWARRRGYEIGLVDVQRHLVLPVADDLLDRLAAEAATRHEGYTVRSWVGPVPDELLEGWAALVATLMTEAPTGDLDLEPESADVGLVRAGEEVLAKQGRTKLNTVALAPDGDLVAYTDLVVTVHEPEKAYQWGTLVRRDHRGHRLGLAVKVANLRLLQREGPPVRLVATANAEVNDHMISVNERLGFRPVARLGELHKRLG